MALPDGWEEGKKTNLDEGHKEHGRTVAVHSLAVLPGYQGKGLGRTLMKSYIQRIESACIADRIVLISHDHLVPMYEKLGFASKGPSKATIGGGGWTDMVSPFAALGYKSLITSPGPGAQEPASMRRVSYLDRETGLEGVGADAGEREISPSTHTGLIQNLTSKACGTIVLLV